MTITKYRGIIFLATVFFCAALPLRALDFGTVIQHTGEYTANAGEDPEGKLDYTASFSPWVSAELGRTARLYLSGMVSTVYEGGEWKPESPPFLPELGLFRISWRPASSAYLELGRIRYQDPLGAIAAGLFDGLNGSVVFGKARLSLGAYYTGFLYKETTEILMTASDMERYAAPFDYGDMKSYAGSRRGLVTAEAELNDLTPRTAMTVSGLGQFDLNSEALEGESALYTQYLTLRYTFKPLEMVTVAMTGVGGLAERKEGGINRHYAAAGGIDWEVPGSLLDMLQGEVRWSSGEVNEGIRAFAPVTSLAEGEVFSPKLSGLMTVKGKYTARPSRSISASMEGTYFMRTDGETLTGTGYPVSESRFLGGEVYGKLFWIPAEDFMVRLGGGAFFPGWGNVFEADTPVRWKVSAGFVFSL